MALKTYKPVTPGQRQLVLVDRAGLHKGKPVKALTRGQKRPAGRNNLGRIVVRWQPKKLVLFEANEFALYEIERSLNKELNFPLVPVLGSTTTPTVWELMMKRGDSLRDRRKSSCKTVWAARISRGGDHVRVLGVTAHQLWRVNRSLAVALASRDRVWPAAAERVR